MRSEISSQKHSATIRRSRAPSTPTESKAEKWRSLALSALFSLVVIGLSIHLSNLQGSFLPMPLRTYDGGPVSDPPTIWELGLRLAPCAATAAALVAFVFDFIFILDGPEARATTGSTRTATKLVAVFLLVLGFFLNAVLEAGAMPGISLSHPLGGY
jgi:hypothetical protein